MHKPMRRKDRALETPAQWHKILRAHGHGVLVLQDSPYPYAVPMTYGLVITGETFHFYFHCANEGTKLDRMRDDPHAVFVVHAQHAITGSEKACSYSAFYESIIVRGRLAEVTSLAEKETGLQAIMRQCTDGKDFPFTAAETGMVTVLRLTAEQITGKANPVPNA